jgi:hypothetical protein
MGRWICRGTYNLALMGGARGLWFLFSSTSLLLSPLGFVGRWLLVALVLATPIPSRTFVRSPR